jgi:hypothetical protein
MSVIDPARTSWEVGNNNIRPIRDINKEFLELEGELSDEQARATLAEFLWANPSFMFDIIGGIKLFPMQELILKAWSRNDYNLAVWSRGASKSWTCALFAIYWALFNPGTRVVIISFSFRASRRILEQCEKFVNDTNAVLLKSCFPTNLRRGTDEYKWDLPNQSSILCLPLGDGKKIRGVRADLLIVDEFAFLPESIVGEILRPFLAANNKINEQLSTKEREDELIRRGAMTEAERTIIDDRKKVIFLSSACFSFEHLYRKYSDWVGLLTKPERMEEIRKSGMSYFISRIGWEAIPAGLLNIKEIEEAKRDLSEAVFNREYGALFSDDSDGFFRASKMHACTIPDGATPCLEIVGDKEAEYVLSIDSSSSGSETSDFFAMIVQKIVKRETDQKELGMVVHSYAVAGGNLKDHMLYFLYLVQHFNLVWIVTDASQGDEGEFINFCNESQMFKDAHVQFSDIQADFKKEQFSELPPQIKRSYSKSIGRIVQKQPMGSVFQRAANEYLQAAFDHKQIYFAAKIAANSAAAGRAMNMDISMIQRHEEFKDTSISDFISQQDNLVDVIKSQCATIQVKTTDLGTLSFGLPQNLRRTTGSNRARKDLYSALVLGCWAIKLYLESRNVEIQTGPPNFPYYGA